MQAAAPPPGPRPFTWPASSIPRHHGNVCVSPRSSSRRSNSSGSSVCVCVCVCVRVCVRHMSDLLSTVFVAVYLK